MAGTYNEGVELSVSGTAGNPIVFTPYQGGTYPPKLSLAHSVPGKVILDGTGLPAGTLGFSLTSISYVIISGFEIQYFTASTTAVPMGIGIFTTGSNIWILNNYIHHIRNTGSTSSHNAHGIAVYGTSTTPISGLVIDSNEVAYCVLGFSESITLDGNIVNWMISNNIVHDNNNIGIVVIGGYESCSDPAQDRARFGQITGNVVFAISALTNPAYSSLAADGIYVDGGGSLSITNNIIYDCDIGMEVTSEIAGWYATNVTVSNNIIYHSAANGISIGGYDATVG
jgi:hypothetical protein